MATRKNDLDMLQQEFSLLKREQHDLICDLPIASLKIVEKLIGNERAYILLILRKFRTSLPDNEENHPKIDRLGLIIENVTQARTPLDIYAKTSAIAPRKKEIGKFNCCVALCCGLPLVVILMTTWFLYNIVTYQLQK